MRTRPVLPAVVLAAAAVAACPPERRDQQFAPCRVTSDGGTTAVAQSLTVLAGQFLVAVPARGLVCVPGSTEACAAILAGCTVDEGDVAVGTKRVVTVDVESFGAAGVAFDDVGLAPGSCVDAYVEGPTSFFLAAGETRSVNVVLRPLRPGPCEATLLFPTSGYTNAGDAPARIVIRADAPDDGTIVVGCGTADACCCGPSGVASEPTCADQRVSCAAGWIAFDDRCMSDAWSCVGQPPVFELVDGGAPLCPATYCTSCTSYSDPRCPPTAPVIGTACGDDDFACQYCAAPDFCEPPQDTDGVDCAAGVWRDVSDTVCDAFGPWDAGVVDAGPHDAGG